MSRLRPAPAKILCHANGMGAPDVDSVRQRARELALIAGHSEYTEEDWRQARFELHGGHDHDSEISEEMGSGSMVSEADMVAIDVGHQVDRMRMEDDGNLGEELWREGMEEAEHERMLVARREDPARGDRE